MLTIALDIGGTFTDLTALDDETGTVLQAKASTTPAALEIGIQKCIEKSGLDVGKAHSFVHGSTVAINIAIERTGAETALIVTEGTRDVYSIGRGNRPEAYNLFFRRPVPYVPRQRVYEISERLNAAGEVLVSIDEDDLARAIAALKASKAEATAVCLLHSYANSEHENKVGFALAGALPSVYSSLSHAVVSEYGEYERMSTTVMNAYIGPKVSDYVDRLDSLLKDSGFTGLLLIMQSNGGVMTADVAKKFPVRMMESGPVGGIVAAAQVGKRLGYLDVIAFDMGGTTAKASLIRDAEPQITHGYYIGGYVSGQPVLAPVVDVIEVGSGGGSIAWIDEVGALKVGPKSAGGDPGPVCYGWGGSEPTVTDANAVLGRIGPRSFLGGEILLDVASARQAIIDKVAAPVGLDAVEAAVGIIRIAVAQMSLAVRGVSVERGYDPRDFALVACGGAGPLHVAQVARELHIPLAIVPCLPAHFSALGMLLADIRHDYVQTAFSRLENVQMSEMRRLYGCLLDEAHATLREEGVADSNMSFQRFIDMRYVGQDFSVHTPIAEASLSADDSQELRKGFDDIHARRYGHKASGEPVEMVNVRLTARGRRIHPDVPTLDSVRRDALKETRSVYFDEIDGWIDCPIYDRELLHSGQEIEGPAIIEEYASTTLLFPGDIATVKDTGELVIRIGGVYKD